MLRFYKGSILFTLVCLALAVAYGWMQTGTASGTMSLLWIVFVLSILEISLSFDNAVVNAASKLGTRRWGLILAQAASAFASRLEIKQLGEDSPLSDRLERNIEPIRRVRRIIGVL